MTTLSQFTGTRSVATIVNSQSSSPCTSKAASGLFNGKTYASGALTANVLKTMLSVSGGGQVNVCSVFSIDTTSKTIRLVLVVDGVTVFDSTTTANTTQNNGVIALGTTYSGQPVRFYSSLLIQIASDEAATDKLTACINYETDA